MSQARPALNSVFYVIHGYLRQRQHDAHFQPVDNKLGTGTGRL
jgi:hypothetical protein